MKLCTFALAIAMMLILARDVSPKCYDLLKMGEKELIAREEIVAEFAPSKI